MKLLISAIWIAGVLQVAFCSGTVPKSGVTKHEDSGNLAPKHSTLAATPRLPSSSSGAAGLMHKMLQWTPPAASFLSKARTSTSKTGRETRAIPRLLPHPADIAASLFSPRKKVAAVTHAAKSTPNVVQSKHADAKSKAAPSPQQAGAALSTAELQQDVKMEHLKFLHAQQLSRKLAKTLNSTALALQHEHYELAAERLREEKALSDENDVKATSLTELKQSKKIVEEKEAEVGDLTAALHRADLEKDALRQKLEQSEKLHQEETRQLENEKRDAIRKVAEEVTQLKQHEVALNASFQQQRQKASALTGKLSEEVSTLKETQQLLRKSLSAEKAKAEEAAARQLRMENLVFSEHDTMLEMKNEALQEKHENGQAKEALQKSSEQGERLYEAETKVAALMAMNKKLAKENIEHLKVLSAARRKLKDEESVLGKATSKLKSDEAKLALLQTHDDQVASMRSKLGKFMELNSELSSKLSAAKQSIKEREEDVASLTKEKDLQDQAIELTRKRLLTFEKHLSDAVQQKSTHSKEVTAARDLRKQLQLASSRESSLLAKVEAEEKREARLREDNSQLHAEVAAMSSKVHESESLAKRSGGQADQMKTLSKEKVQLEMQVRSLVKQLSYESIENQKLKSAEAEKLDLTSKVKKLSAALLTESKEVKRLEHVESDKAHLVADAKTLSASLSRELHENMKLKSEVAAESKEYKRLEHVESDKAHLEADAKTLSASLSRELRENMKLKSEVAAAHKREVAAARHISTMTMQSHASQADSPDDLASEAMKVLRKA